MVARLCKRMDWPDTNSESKRIQGIPEEQIFRGGVQTSAPGTDRDFPGRNYWETEPDVDRVAYGIPHRVDRIKCLGNAVVPQQFYPFFKAIAILEGEEIERQNNTRFMATPGTPA
jgi:DNA (cytosine-5)-methyltransferase 1